MVLAASCATAQARSARVRAGGGEDCAAVGLREPTVARCSEDSQAGEGAAPTEAMPQASRAHSARESPPLPLPLPLPAAASRRSCAWAARAARNRGPAPCEEAATASSTPDMSSTSIAAVSEEICGHSREGLSQSVVAL